MKIFDEARAASKRLLLKELNSTINFNQKIPLSRWA